jgi:hypothetical protein
VVGVVGRLQLAGWEGGVPAEAAEEEAARRKAEGADADEEFPGIVEPTEAAEEPASGNVSTAGAPPKRWRQAGGRNRRNSIIASVAIPLARLMLTCSVFSITHETPSCVRTRRGRAKPDGSLGRVMPRASMWFATAD